MCFFLVLFAGANDVGNAFGSSVGAKALTMKQAICVAAVCEFVGATLMVSANSAFETPSYDAFILI
jgi:solute carrier family 20 (sodium-dependent phosphate transporter)